MDDRIKLHWQENQYTSDIQYIKTDEYVLEPLIMIIIIFNHCGNLEKLVQMCTNLTDGSHFKFKVQALRVQEP